MRGNKTLTEGLINTREFINGVNNSNRDYYEKTIRFFGGGGVIITLTSLIELYVTDNDTNKTILFTTLETDPANKYDWGWELRDKLLDLEIILGRSNWRKELGLEDSHTKGVDLTGKKVRYRGMTAKVLRKLTEQEKQKRAHLINPDAGDYYEIEIISKVTAAPKLTVWEGELHDSLTEATDFYGTKQGSEKADDILFALQAHYGLPKYDYDDFRKMNLTQEEVNEAIAYAERDELNKFTYFDSLTEDANNEREGNSMENNNNQLKWLLNLPEGYLVAISACVGTDCSLTDTMESMLRVEFDHIKVVGKWDGIEETSFLVFTENENMAKALVQTGIYDFNQEDVYVWKTPMTMVDITEGTNEGTKLDDKYYYFDLDKIVLKRENVIVENQNGNKTLNEREGNKMSIEQRVISVLDELSYLDKIREHAYNYYYNKSDYRDRLEPETIDGLITSAKSGDLMDAWYDLTSNFDDVGYVNEYITNDVVEALEKVAPLTDEEFDEVNQLIWESIQIDYTTYLDDEVPVYIMVDTGDGNYDFTLNPNYSFNWDGETVEDEPLELASLTWLAGTQGYTLDQVLEAFREGGSHNKFLNSVVREGLENNTSMTAVTFLGTMRILDLLNAASGNGDVTINTDTYVGLFDTWSGSGSLFDIELEQGLVIPGNIINRIGTARGKGDNGYTPDHVYGFSGSVYDSKINLLKDLDRDVLGESKNFVGDNIKSEVHDKMVREFEGSTLNKSHIEGIVKEILEDIVDERINIKINYQRVSNRAILLAIIHATGIKNKFQFRFTLEGLGQDRVKVEKVETIIVDAKDSLNENKTLNETEEVYYTGAIYDIENIAQDFEEDEEDVILNGLIDLRDSGLMVVYYRPSDRDIIATGTKEQFKEFVKTNKYMSEYDWHAYGGGGAMVDELIAMEALWLDDDSIENIKRYSTNLDNEIKKLLLDLPEEKINKLNENKDSLTEDAFDYDTMHKINDYIDRNEDKVERMSAKQIFEFVKKQFSNVSNIKIAESLEYVYSGSRLNFAQFKDPLNENKILTEDISEDNLTIVLNYVFNTDQDNDQYGDSFLYDIDIWKGNDHLYPTTKPVYQTHEEMMNGDDYDIDYALRQALQEAYPEYIIEYAEILGELYDMTAIINYLDEDGDYIDIQVPVQLEEIEDTAWDDETRLSFWA